MCDTILNEMSKSQDIWFVFNDYTRPPMALPEVYSFW